jgi:hypothetical protein
VPNDVIQSKTMCDPTPTAAKIQSVMSFALRKTKRARRATTSEKSGSTTKEWVHPR